jgi:hypothetical protein
MKTIQKNSIDFFVVTRHFFVTPLWRTTVTTRVENDGAAACNGRPSQLLRSCSLATPLTNNAEFHLHHMAKWNGSPAAEDHNERILLSHDEDRNFILIPNRKITTITSARLIVSSPSATREIW